MDLIKINSDLKKKIDDYADSYGKCDDCSMHGWMYIARQPATGKYWLYCKNDEEGCEYRTYIRYRWNSEWSSDVDKSYEWYHIYKPPITSKDFSLGKDFWMSGLKYRCTDIGLRTINAIRINDSLDNSWYHGPPYAVVEIVIDEFDMKCCSFEFDKYQQDCLNWRKK